MPSPRLPEKSRFRGLHRALAASCAAALLFSTGCSMLSSPLQLGFGNALGISPFAEWKTLETEHFRLSFPEELSEVALKASDHFEEAHALLSPRLHWTPNHKVSVLLLDNNDASNGLASPGGRFGIVLMATPPQNWFSIYHYDDWLRLLAIHEYTHYLNMDPTDGAFQVLRILFGDVVQPNGLWPSWMLEGLAVYMETQLTRSGRGRSPYYEMILRAAVEENLLDTHRFVTIDRINGDNPYFPGGETAYLFGYQLMSRVARENEPALGELSRNSSSSLPFLINTRLSRLTGKDWYDYWAQWVDETRARAQRDLDQIRSKPVTPFERLTQGGGQTLGSAFSPDGRWAAYTRESPDQPMALHLLDRKSGLSRPLLAKAYGATLAFTPDSEAVVFSGHRRRGGYTTYSDLAVYELKQDRVRWLSKGLRARDPDVSRDGRWVVFTHAATSRTGISVAPLERDPDSGKYRLGEVKRVFEAALFEAAATPRFSADGKSVYFTLHRAGKTREELMSLELESGKLTELVADGSFNRFPSVHPDGSLHFVSDRSGVENVYRYAPGQEPQVLTNVTTGLSFPSFDPEGKLHANLFSFSGWDLAVLKPERGPATVNVERIPPPEAPEPEAPGPSRDPSVAREILPYRPWQSLWPRQWSPFAEFGSEGRAIFGGQVQGFDALELHRYFATLSYDTEIRKPNWGVLYSNRSLGATLSIRGSNETDSWISLGSTVLAYTRRARASVEASYPIRWNLSSLTPSVGLNLERTILVMPGAAPAASDIIARTPLLSSVDLAAGFTDALMPSLGITPESGRSVVVASRLYPGLKDPVWKFVVKDTEYVNLGRHHVLVPAAKASWATRHATERSSTSVDVQGRFTQESLQSLAGDSLDELGIRGYPARAFRARSAGALSLDYRFPLLPVYRGWGTNPAFLNSIFGFAFAETTVFPGSDPGVFSLPAAGAGARLSSEILLRVPLVLSVEYHHGFRRQKGGVGEVFFQMGFGNFTF